MKTLILISLAIVANQATPLFRLPPLPDPVSQLPAPLPSLPGPAPVPSLPGQEPPLPQLPAPLPSLPGPAPVSPLPEPAPVPSLPEPVPSLPGPEPSQIAHAPLPPDPISSLSGTGSAMGTQNQENVQQAVGENINQNNIQHQNGAVTRGGQVPTVPAPIPSVPEPVPSLPAAVPLQTSPISTGSVTGSVTGTQNQINNQQACGTKIDQHNNQNQIGNVNSQVPAPVPTHPAPVPKHPAPVPTHPAPVPTHPAPVPTHPAPVPTHPAPVPTHPAPEPIHPVPTPTVPDTGSVTGTQNEINNQQASGTEIGQHNEQTQNGDVNSEAPVPSHPAPASTVPDTGSVTGSQNEINNQQASGTEISQHNDQYQNGNVNSEGSSPVSSPPAPVSTVADTGSVTGTQNEINNQQASGTEISQHNDQHQNGNVNSEAPMHPVTGSSPPAQVPTVPDIGSVMGTQNEISNQQASGTEIGQHNDQHQNGNVNSEGSAPVSSPPAPVSTVADTGSVTGTQNEINNQQASGTEISQHNEQSQIGDHNGGGGGTTTGLQNQEGSQQASGDCIDQHNKQNQESTINH